MDLYPEYGCEEAESPTKGTVKIAERLKIMDDYLIVLKTDSDSFIKILHVKPCVDIGCEISVGDILGRFHWSPFFNPWTDLHMHVELRPSWDLIRARGGYELNINPIITYMENYNGNDLEVTFRVVEVNERYYLLENERKIKPYTTPFALRLGNSSYFLDGGVPHYGHGALLCYSNDTCEITNNIRADFRRKKYIHFKCHSNPLYMNGSLWRGVGAFINRPFLKLIPLQPCKNSLQIGSELSLKELYNIF